MKSDNTPMSKAHAAPRCTAKSKRTGNRCKGPAVRGWTVCRFHGAGGGQKAGPSHPSWKHGARSGEAIRNRKRANQLAKSLRGLLEEAVMDREEGAEIGQ